MSGSIVLLLFVLSLSWGQNPPGDRGSCDRCDTHLHCDCSGSGLTAVPMVTDRALALDLSFNDIPAINDGDLSGHRQLKALSLHANRVSRIDLKALWSLWSLEELDLSQNRLTFLNHKWFSKLGALQRLKVHNNPYKRLGSPPPFQDLFRLKSLSFGGDVLEEISRTDLKNVAELDELHVDANNLKRYESGALADIWPLGRVTLSLRSAFLSNQSVAAAMLHDVSYPETLLVLENIDLSNKQSVLPFKEVAQRRVRHLAFHNCFLTDESVVDWLEVMDGAPIASTTLLNITMKGVGRWEKASSTDHKNLDEFFVRNAAVLDVFQFTSFLPLSFLLQYLRKVSIINARVFVLPCLTSFLLKNLQYLDLSENLLTDMTLAETLCYGVPSLKDLRVLNFSSNALKSLSLVSHLVSRLSKLTHLDISRNGYSSMPQSCSWPSSLRFLNISRSKLTSVTPCLPTTLQVLDLSYNDLQGFFLVLPALRELHLSGNKFLTLPPGWAFPNLQTLTIQSNTLNLFSRSDLLLYSRLENFEAGNNKFVCSCGFVPFFQSLINGDMSLRLTDGKDSYTCDSPLHLQGESLALVQRSLLECQPVLVVSVSCGVALFVGIVVTVLFWRLHVFWYMKMAFVWLRAKRSSERRSRHRADSEPLVAFDAFVSYSERDAGWVENYLVPELEQTGDSERPGPSSRPQSLKLCLHKRDFLPGRWIMDNIMSAIECSRKTVFVLSENFVSSDWCRYELDFTHFQLFEGNSDRDASILVLLEPLTKDDIPKRFCKLRKLMSSTTYLEWPQDQDKRDGFWASLRNALSPDVDPDLD